MLTTKSKILLEHNVDIESGLIHISGDVDVNLFDKMVHDINIVALHKPELLNELTIYLSTYGGDVYYGFAMYDYLKLTTKNLKIVCIGPVMSAGTLILQAAKERLMTANAYLLVHFGMEINENQQIKQHNDELTKKIKKVLIDKCSAKEQTVKKWFSKESYFNERRAKEVGLVDGVIEVNNE